jgi:hypothetical protein
MSDSKLLPVCGKYGCDYLVSCEGDKYCWHCVCWHYPRCIERRDGPGTYACRDHVLSQDECKICNRDRNICGHYCSVTGCPCVKRGRQMFCTEHLCRRCRQPFDKEVIHSLVEKKGKPYYAGPIYRIPFCQIDGLVSQYCFRCVASGTCRGCGAVTVIGKPAHHAESCRMGHHD